MLLEPGSGMAPRQGRPRLYTGDYADTIEEGGAPY